MQNDRTAATSGGGILIGVKLVKVKTKPPVRAAVVTVGPVLISGYKLDINLWFEHFPDLS
jgi:hypothetical protein